MSTRRDRVSDLIRAEVSRLLLHEMRDPRIGFVTITGATISPDLKNVRIFAFSGMRRRGKTRCAP